MAGGVHGRRDGNCSRWYASQTWNHGEMLHVFFTVCNSSCRKVMFSQACVKNSVHRGDVCGRGDVWQGMAYMARATCMAGDGMHGRGWHVWQGGMHSKGWHAWQGMACIAGGMHGRGWQGGMHGRRVFVTGSVHRRRDGHCSRWYASYCNTKLRESNAFSHVCPSISPWGGVDPMLL